MCIRDRQATLCEEEAEAKSLRGSIAEQQANAHALCMRLSAQCVLSQCRSRCESIEKYECGVYCVRLCCNLQCKVVAVEARRPAIVIEIVQHCLCACNIHNASKSAN